MKLHSREIKVYLIITTIVISILIFNVLLLLLLSIVFSFDFCY